MNETGQAAALVNLGSPGDTLHGIGGTMRAGAWFLNDGYTRKPHGKVTDGRRRIWRNPDLSNGDLRFQPARFGTIGVWQAQKATGWFLFDFLRQLKQLGYDLDALRKPLELDWDSSWIGPGATQGQSADNGIIVMLDAAGVKRYEFQGLAPLSVWDIAQINLQAGATPVARAGDYRCDGVFYSGAGIAPHGSQGPIGKLDGLLRPSYLAGPVIGPPLRIVVRNVAYGPKAKAAPGGWVEHPLPGPPYPELAGLPEGDDPMMVRSFQGFWLDITDPAIEQWLDAEKATGDLRASKKQLAVNLRGDRKRATFRCSESGTARTVIFETSGASEAEGWARRGIVTDTDMGNLGHGLFDHGTVMAT